MSKKITDLQLRDEVTDDLSIPSDDGIQSYRVTGLQVYNFIKAKLLTATGDMIYSSSGSTPAKLAIGLAQQIIRPVAGVPAWAWPYATQRTATTTDAINASTDHVVLMNAVGGAFTATLPTAASVAGKVYILKKTDSTLNAVTIATTSSQTIDGVTTTSLNTQYETLYLISDGSNWIVLQRDIPSQFVAYTPTTAGWGTVSAVNIFSRRIRDSLQMRGNIVLGTVTAATATMTFGLNGVNAPSGLVASSTKVTNLGSSLLDGVGVGHRSATGTAAVSVLTNAGDGGLKFSLIAHASLASNVGQLGNAAFQTGERFHFNALIPIEGWKG